MKLRYLGHACFLLESDTGTKLITDPYPQGIFPHETPLVDGVTLSHRHFDHCDVASLPGDPAVIEGCGSFALKDICITGYPSFHDDRQGSLRGSNTVFVFELEGKRIAHLGDLGELPSPSLLSAVKGVDVLLIPIGGTYTLDGKQAAEAVKLIEPKCVVPMHYALPGYDMNISDQEPFLAALSAFTPQNLPLIQDPLPAGLVLLDA